MKILQTLATDNWDNLSYRKQSQILLYHCVSINSIRQVYGEDQEIILITDTNGANIAEVLEFPYTSINTALDNYPYTRPLRPVGYKLYGFELYPNDDIIHFDNDVFIKTLMPEFTDVLVQGHEGNFIEFLLDTNTGYVYNDWEYPPGAMSGSVCKLAHNYNPGVLGLKADCSIREEYVSGYNTYLERNTNNLLQLKEDTPTIFNEISEKEHQYINTALEESYLYHLCQDNSINVTTVEDQYEEMPEPVLWNRELANSDEVVFNLLERHYDYWKELGYIHPFSHKKFNKEYLIDLLGNFDTPSDSTFIPTMVEPITHFLEKRWGISEKTTNEGVAIALRFLCKE